jgi:PAS domain S-box-containing protein
VTDEEARVEELRRYDLLDPGQDPSLARLAEVASLALGAPIALVTVLDESRQVARAQHGVTLGEIPREHSFCAHALEHTDLLVIEDATLDPRVAKNPFVIGPPGVRFYAGAPLITPRGLVLGTLCVLDLRPRHLEAHEERTLRLLRDQVMEAFEIHRELVELRRSESLREEAVEALIATKTDLEARIELRTREVEASRRRLAEAQAFAHVGSWEWSVASNRVVWSEEMYRIYGLGRSEFAGTYEAFLGRLDPADVELTKNVIGAAYQNPSSFVYDHRIVRPDGSVRMLHTRGDVVTDDEKRPVRMVGSCWDITDQWRAARDLDGTLAVLRATLEAAPVGVLVGDEQGVVRAINSRFLTLAGLDVGTARPGAREADLVAACATAFEDGEPLLELAKGVATNPARSADAHLKRKNGGPLTCRLRPYLVEGKPAGRLWSFDDR